MTAYVRARKDEPIESLLKRFNKEVAESKTLVDHKESLSFVSEPEQRRSEKNKEKSRIKKYREKKEKQLDFINSNKRNNNSKNKKSELKKYIDPNEVEFIGSIEIGPQNQKKKS